MNREPSALLPETVWMDARIRPNIALSGTGAATFSFLIAFPSALVGITLLLQGLWLASVFVGAASSLIIVMMLHQRKSLSAYEERVLLTDAALIVETSVSRRKPPVRRRLSADWLKIERRIDEDGGCSSLVLWSREKPYTIASVLSPIERAAFADALELRLRQRSRRAA